MDLSGRNKGNNHTREYKTKLKPPYKPLINRPNHQTRVFPLRTVIGGSGPWRLERDTFLINLPTLGLYRGKALFLALITGFSLLRGVLRVSQPPFTSLSNLHYLSTDGVHAVLVQGCTQGGYVHGGRLPTYLGWYIGRHIAQGVPPRSGRGHIAQGVPRRNLSGSQKEEKRG